MRSGDGAGFRIMYGHPYKILLTSSAGLFTIRQRMKYEFSLAHLTILSCSPPDLIEIAAEAGYDYVSLRPIAVTPNEPKYPLGEDQNLLRQTRSALDATGSWGRPGACTPSNPMRTRNSSSRAIRAVRQRASPT